MTDHVFEDSVVIVTGASLGIGREVALQLAGRGARLVLAARQVDKLEEAAQECRQRGGQALVVPTDVSLQADCRLLVERSVQEYGRIDMLVNNAGRTMWALIDEIQDPCIFEEIMRINYFGCMYCTYYALPHLKQTRGRIVGVSSVAGKSGVPTRTGYAASKHAMVGFLDSLRIELQGSGVSVTIAYPDFVATGMQSRGFGTDGQALGYNPVKVEKVMTTEECARRILSAAARRKREEIMTLRAKLGVWLKLIAPEMVDRIARKAIKQGR
ncbi:MAG: SDR family oxidoreductase [Chloroflexi bacterium]|nr:SDR family oxidoreductase [Chloroflexota bacterium]